MCLEILTTCCLVLLNLEPLSEVLNLVFLLSHILSMLTRRPISWNRSATLARADESFVKLEMGRSLRPSGNEQSKIHLILSLNCCWSSNLCGTPRNTIPAIRLRSRGFLSCWALATQRAYRYQPCSPSVLGVLPASRWCHQGSVPAG